LVTDNDELQDARAAAEFLNWHPGTLANRRARGEPPAFIRLGKSIRYKRSDLVEFVESNRVEPVRSR
jgi:hypothetical protein